METYNKLFKILQPDDLILTLNQRLISFLYKHYADYQKEQKRINWFTPHIHRLESWLTWQWETQLIQNNSFLYRLLTKNQERLIWQSLIEKSNTHLLRASSIAQTAQQAWQLHHQWQLDDQSAQLMQNHESCTWKRWAKQFIDFSQDHACIDFTTAVTRLTDLFRKKKLIAPQRIFLLGFDEINPQYKKLFQALEHTGCQITTFTARSPKPTVRRLMLDTTDIELQTMARWAYHAWQAGTKNIICAIPRLMEIRTSLVNSFTEVFTGLSGKTLDSLPFNIAAGRKLSEFSAIQVALTIVQLKTINPIPVISMLLGSPYLASTETEQSQRAQLDIYLRRHAESHISLERLSQWSKQHCPRFSRSLRQLITLFHPDDIKQYPSQWASFFSTKLQTLAWPGQRRLHSEEYQLIERWSELLSEFSGFDFILGKLSEEAASHHLSHLASTSLFQTKTLHEPPIHVLGLLDTAGLCADALWVMGLDDRAWPTAAHPNPFIPHALQRTYSLPHATNERELYFSSLVTQRLLNSASTIILSHAAQTQEHISRPSTLISKIPRIDITELNLPPYQSVIESIWKTQRWEYDTDENAPVLQTHELINFSSRLLKSQAACPFQAFAHFRLNAHFYPLPQTGLNRMDRGSLLHEVLANLWNQLGDHASLLKQSDPSLQTLLDHAINQSIKTFSKTHPFTFQTQFINLERERLQQRLIKIINLDKKRSAFKNVRHETQCTLRISNVSFNLRIDRLDELTDGSLLIIDYKTGTPPNKSDWLESRLDEPQLPLYCLSQKHAKGFAIIYIRSDTLKVSGLSEMANDFSPALFIKKNKNNAHTWSALLQQWQTTLESLTQQFQAGVANVDPKYGENTCRHCHLKLLCRIKHDEKPV